MDGVGAHSRTDLGLRETQLTEGERRFRELFARSRDGFVVLDASGRFLDANPAYCAMVGYSLEELRALPSFLSITPECWHQWETREMLGERLLDAGGSGLYEKEYIRKDGTVFPVEVQAYAVWHDDGSLDCIWGIVRDITDRRQAERALSENEERWRALFEASPMGIYLYRLDDSGRLIFEAGNPAADRLTGVDSSRFLGKTIEEAFPPLAATEVPERYRRAAQDGERWRTDQIAYDDGPIHGAFTVHAFQIAPNRMAVMFDEITERKRAEQALRESQERLESIVRVAPVGIGVVRNRVFVEVNARVCEMTGYSAEELIGQSARVLYPTDAEYEWVGREKYGQIAERGTGSVETRWRTKDGTIRDILLASTPLDPSDLSKGVTFTALDITDRKRAEEALRRTQFAMDHAPDSVLWVGENGEITYANHAACASMGYSREELTGLTVFDIDPDFPREEWAEHVARMEREGRMRFESRHRAKDGRVFPVEVSSNYVPFEGRFNAVAFDRDISERKRAEEERERLRSQLVQAQKMESVGRLAGGVAHDFNNMLGVILGHAELALQQVDPSQELAASLREIRKAAERSAELTRQLLAFARKQTVAPRVIDLNEAVGAMLSMLRRLIGEAITLVWLPCPGPCLVNIDPSQVDQILANLCVNARDAIGGTGHVTIETATVAPGEALPPEVESSAPGEYVLLSVTDDGCGMDAEERSHLFEPFFTTKGVGKGTGLGLATVYGIVHQNQGFINVHSEPGQGTTFRIYLPRHPGETASPADEDAARPALGGDETILLVEDEPTILDLVATMLRGQGYTVLAASTPGEGLRLAQEHRGKIELLITDVIMPEMNGLELAQRLQATYPALRWLFMSGYPADTIAHHGVLDPDVCFIEKPFKMGDLAAKVREALGRASG